MCPGSGAPAEREHDRVLLKTEQPRNVDLYHHLGFRTVTEGTAPSGLRTWFLATG